MAFRIAIRGAVLEFFVLAICAQPRPPAAFATTASPPSSTTKILAVYEPWFGHPRHIDVGYSSQDPVVIKKQIAQARSLGISGFVVDWYGDREPFLDKSYSLMQRIAGETGFTIAMMYDETDKEAAEATDDALVAFDSFREKYLAAGRPGQKAYLTYKGRPVIFIFPKGGQTDWNRVRVETNRWTSPPILIYQYRQTSFPGAFDGFFAWINPGKKGWAPDGGNWGADYLQDFYEAMQAKYPDKLAVGAAWPGFDDHKASWSLGRRMSRRCGATLSDTLKLNREHSPAENPRPFLLLATWNDYEEGSAVERTSEKCEEIPKPLSP